MKRVFWIASFAALALGQQVTPIRHGDVDLRAITQTADGPVRHLRGQAVIETDSMILRADEADFNVDSHEIQARGDVRVKLK